MKTTISALTAMVMMTFFACQNHGDLTSATPDSDLVLKSATIAETDVTVESVLEETGYEANFFAESEHLLRQLAHLRGSHDLLEGRHNHRYAEDSGPVVSIDTADAGYPIVITIEYGDSTVLHHGRVISGTVNIEISAPKNTDRATRTITFSDCVVDSVSINGVSTEVFSGDNTNSRTITSTTFVTFVLADGTVIQRSGTHTRDWLQGLDAPMEHDDDLIEITGSDEITSSEGYSWSKTIIEPLVKSGECRNIVQGIVQYTSNNEVIAELNYGDGTCDSTVILTANGVEVEIELKGKRAEAHMEGHHSEGGYGH